MAQIPKAMIVGQIRRRIGAAKTKEAYRLCPDKLDSDNDAGLLQKYGLSSGEITQQLGGGSPSIG